MKYHAAAFAEFKNVFHLKVGVKVIDLNPENEVKPPADRMGREQHSERCLQKHRVMLEKGRNSNGPLMLSKVYSCEGFAAQ